jgi:hypothetical protein
MPLSHWLSDAHGRPDGPGDHPARSMPEQLAGAQAAKLRDANRLLDELQEATRGLGEAFAGAGFPPSAWRSHDARLAALSDQLPNVRLEDLLRRLAAFAMDTGPAWLAGDEAALDQFGDEVERLAAAIRPLRALALRTRMHASSARSRHALERALGNARVGAQLDRLAHTLGQLAELAPLLEAPSSQPPAGLSAPEPAPWDPPGPPGLSGEHGARAPEWLVGRDAPAASSAVRTAPHWLGGGLLRRIGLSRRARRVALGLGAGLLVLVVSVTLALMHAGPRPSGATMSLAGSRASASARATPSRSATPSPARTAVGSPTPAPDPAQLALSAASVVLPCSGSTVTLRLSNTGGQTLTWQARVTGNAVLSATSGSIGPHSSSALDAHASGSQHGPGSIVFTSNGGTRTVTYKVFCH